MADRGVVKTTVLPGYKPKSVKPGVKHIIEGMPGSQTYYKRTKYGYMGGDADRYGVVGVDWFTDPEETDPKKSVYIKRAERSQSQKLESFKNKMKHRKDIVSLPDPETTVKQQRISALRRRAGKKTRTSTMLSLGGSDFTL